MSSELSSVLSLSPRLALHLPFQRVASTQNTRSTHEPTHASAKALPYNHVSSRTSFE